MNVYTILGAALTDDEFRELLFESPIKAAKRLGLVLTQQELNALNSLVSSNEIEEGFETLQKKVCPNPPCPISLARLCNDHDVTLTIAAD